MWPMFKVAAAGYDAKVASGNMGAYKVTKVDGDRVQVAGGYQTVKDAKVYIPTLDSDNTFEAWTIGSLEDIDIDGIYCTSSDKQEEFQLGYCSIYP